MKKFDKIAIIPLPPITLPGGNVFNTLHGYWIPPNYIIEFWSTGVKIPYISDEDYDEKYIEIRNSQEECVKQFWRENAL